MDKYHGLIISIENYLHPKKIGKVAFANNDSEKVTEAFLQLGCDKDNFELLQDNFATKSAIESKVSKLAKYVADNEIVVFYFAGHGVLIDGVNYITCVDSDVADLASTSVSMEFILSEFEKSKATKVILFLDCCHSGITFNKDSRSTLSEFSTDQLKYNYANSEHLMVFASCKDDELSISDTNLKHGVWSYYLIQALNGNANGIYTNELLFSDNLQSHLHDNTYRTVKQITTDKKNQTPIKYGKETKDKFIVADLTKLFESKVTGATAQNIKFENASIISEDSHYVKTLPGFQKGYTVPKTSDSYHEGWIQQIGEDLVKSIINDISENCRTQLGMKRRDFLQTIVEKGYAQLSTTHFDYKVELTQSKDDPSKFILVQVIENFKNSDILQHENFNDVFSYIFDKIEFTTKEEIDVDAIIDKIEDLNSEDIKVRYPADNSPECTIYGNFIEGEINLSLNSFTFISSSTKRPIELMELCSSAYTGIEKSIKQQLLE